MEKDELCDDLNYVLNFFGAKRMVTGHTPIENGKSEVYSKCNNKYLVIDVRISRYMFRKTKDGTPVSYEDMIKIHSDLGNISALEIIGDNVDAIYKDEDGKIYKVSYNVIPS